MVPRVCNYHRMETKGLMETCLQEKDMMEKEQWIPGCRAKVFYPLLLANTLAQLPAANARPLLPTTTDGTRKSEMMLQKTKLPKRTSSGHASASL